MSSKPVEPQLGAESFSCPHCGAFAQQDFLKIFVEHYTRGKRPVFMSVDDIDLNAIKRFQEEKERDRWLKFRERLAKHSITYFVHPYAENVHWELHNTFASMCHACSGFSIWVEDKVVYPAKNSAIIPHEEMPTDVRRDFDEASFIVDNSPRGAAALLRLCIQKIVIELGEDGGNLNNDIGELVRKGIIDQRMQQALDLVRVVGNSAVHPGQIDLKDDKPLAMHLFNLVNVIVEATISAPKHIQKMFETIVPETIRAQIEKRDAPKQITDQVTRSKEGD